MTTLQRIQDCILEVDPDLQRQDLTVEAELDDDLGFEEIGLYFLAESLTAEFGIMITRHELMEAANLQGIIELIESKRL